MAARARSAKRLNKEDMTSMMNMTLKQLEGMWLTDDCNSSMWIGGTNLERIEICVNRHPFISEHTRFEYEAERNICRISDSVLLWQLFEDESILIRVQTEEGLFDMELCRRKQINS